MNAKNRDDLWRKRSLNGLKWNRGVISMAGVSEDGGNMTGRRFRTGCEWREER